MKRLVRILGLWVAGSLLASLQAQPFPKAASEQIKAEFTDVHRKLLDMAKDFPADHYSYRLRPEMRSFGEVVVHVASGVQYAAKAGRGEPVKWDELNPKDYPNKAAAVALLEKSIAEANASLLNVQATVFAKTVEPWVAVLEHSAEHYGLLVAYYRANGLVPPESRPRGAGK